jgi:hypothetical protein
MVTLDYLMLFSEKGVGVCSQAGIGGEEEERGKV